MGVVTVNVNHTPGQHSMQCIRLQTTDRDLRVWFPLEVTLLLKLFETPWCQHCTKIWDLASFRKPRLLWCRPFDKKKTFIICVSGCVFTATTYWNIESNNNGNKKVLLRERKRHTDRGVSSTPSVVLYEVGYPPVGVPPPAKSDRGVPEVGYPPSGYPLARSGGGYLRWGTPCQGTPPARWGTPPSQVWWGVPKVGYPPPQLAGPGRGTPPPCRCGLTNKVKLLPSLSYYVRGRYR